MAFFVSSSLKMGKLIFMWAPVSLCHLPHQECCEPSDWSDWEDTEEAVNTELLSLSNPWSGMGEGGWGWNSLQSHHCWPWSLPLDNLLGDGWGHKLVPSGSSFWGDSPSQQNLNGCGDFGWAQRHPGPLASIRHSVMAWAIVHWPSLMVNGSAGTYASLPIQVPALVSVNDASLASPKLRPPLGLSSVKQNCTTWACHYHFCEAGSAMAKHILH